MVDTHGDPLGAVQQFVQTIWSQSELDGMLVSVNGSENTIPRPRLIDDKSLITRVNPFKPVMVENAARLVPDLIQKNPGTRLGALLRPCEIRALIEMVKHDSIDMQGFLTVSVDCLGTMSVDEYHWRASRKETSTGLSKEALKFARQGGILAYRYRSACQICVSPEAQGADINISVLGLPVRQHILVQARDQTTAEKFRFDHITNGTAKPNLIDQHERVLSRMAERQYRTMQRVMQSLGESLPRNVDSLIEQFAGCSPCQKCMDVCPICSVSFPRRDLDNRYKREDITRWLISCSGCGMCEQSCSNHLPLGAIFRHIRDILNEEFDYTPGGAIDDPLPQF
jgi:formate dehydrogenase subunit beta